MTTADLRNILTKKEKVIVRILEMFTLVFIFFGAGTYADEIVINKNGETVLLKTDGTWQIMDTAGEDGKLVFVIRNATNSHYKYVRKNDMDEFSHSRVVLTGDLTNVDYTK